MSERAAAATSRWDRMRSPLVTGAVTLAAVGLLHTVDPGRPGHYPPCPLFTLTGLYCPLCGGLRATADLSHGDLAGAFARNPLVPPLLLLLVGLWLRWSWASWRGRACRIALDRRISLLLLGFVVAFGVARNIPGWTWLSPA